MHADRELGDPKLFRVGAHAAFELPINDVTAERSIQHVFEHSLDQLLGVRFIASNHAIGPGGEAAIDTFALDSDSRPVIIAYERSGDVSVVNRGVYALDWLIEHRTDVQWIVQQRLGSEHRQVNWLAPRLLCIAADFSRYDIHMVHQMQRNIELLRYRRFEGDFIMTELIHTQNILSTNRTILELPANVTTRGFAQEDIEAPTESDDSYTINRKLSSSPEGLRNLFDETGHFLRNIGGDVTLRELNITTPTAGFRTSLALISIRPRKS
jgi:hypothetical protein